MPIPSSEPFGWKTFCSAIGVELREHNSITGWSGVEHPVQAVGVDDKGKRLVVFSAETNARSAAMMQGDLQATMLGTSVIVARPLAFDTTNLTKLIAQTLNTTELHPSMLTAWADRSGGADSDSAKEAVNEALTKISGPGMNAIIGFGLPFIPQAVSLIQQFAGVDLATIYDKETGTIRLTEFLNQDNLAQDRKYGVCPIPLYELSPDDWDMMARPDSHGDFALRLKELGIYQYFYPSPDALVLGLVERGVHQQTTVAEVVQSAPSLGHPLASPEITSAGDIPAILEELKEIGYIAEGEHGVEITEAGRTQRTTIKFRPRESFTSKLLARLNIGVSLSPKDFMS